jgi:DNA-binding transcriptional regulator YiaG
MPNLSTVLRSEISRLARKEVKGAVDPLRKANAGYRRDIAEMKRQLASLQRDVKAASKARWNATKSEKASKPASRFVPNGLKSLRVRLGLSAADFGLLVGASGQSVYNWESGKSVPRGSQQEALSAVRSLGKREAGRRLAALA